eukprot:ANDGO_01036.mRNA.1 Condensin-2 complex subunit H2
MKELQELLSAVLANAASEWDIDLSGRLEEYFREISSLHFTFHIEPGKAPVSNLDFIEAATIIRDSTSIYSKKIENLHGLLYHTLSKLTGTAPEEAAGKGPRDVDMTFKLNNSYWGDEDAPLLPLDDLPEGKNIDLPMAQLDANTHSQPTRAVGHAVSGSGSQNALSLQDALALSFQAVVAPLVSVGGADEPRLRIAECSLNESGILDIRMSQQEQGSWNPQAISQESAAKDGSSQIQTQQAFDEDLGFGGGDFDGGVYSPVGQNSDAGLGLDVSHVAPRVSASAAPPSPGDPVDVAPSETRQTRSQTRSADASVGQGAQTPVNTQHARARDVWKLLDPHEEQQNALNAPFRKATIPAESKKNASVGAFPKRTTFDTAKPADFRSLYLKQIHEYVHSRRGAAESLMICMSRDATRINRTMRRRRLETVTMAEAIGTAEAVDPPVSSTVDHPGSYGGVEELGFGEDDHDGAGAGFGAFDDGGDLGIDEDFVNDFRDVPEVGRVVESQPQALNYVGYYKRIEEDEELSRRIAEWEAKVLPVLEEQEAHRPFDMKEYKVELLQEVDDVDFAEAMVDKPVYEVCRAFLTVLQLACDGNLLLSGDAETLHLKKVSDELRDVVTVEWTPTLYTDHP